MKSTEREVRLGREIEKLGREIAERKSNRLLERAFEWRFEFPETLASDGTFIGFDAVIGNPPYGVSIKGLDRAFLVTTLGAVPDYEIYYWFINRGLQIVRSGGLLSYIIPNSFLFNVNSAKYRLSLLGKAQFLEILDCTNFSIFPDASVRNCILTVRKGGGDHSLGYRNTKNAKNFIELIAEPISFAKRQDVEAANDNWALLFKQDLATRGLINRLRALPTLEREFDVSQGYIPYRLTDLIKAYGEKEGKAIKALRKWHSNKRVGSDYIEELWGESLTRYAFSPSGSFVKYGPHLAGYVDLRYFNQRRLLVREITSPAIVAAIVDGLYVNDPQIISVVPKTQEISVDLLWCILNSRFAAFFHANASPKATKGLFPKILVRDVRHFPLPLPLDPKDGAWALAWGKKATLMKRKDSAADVSRVEARMNQAVYRLYGLNQSEVDIVEGAKRPS